MNVLVFRLLKDCWTDEEVKVATGKTDCYVVMHSLKVNSSYATVRVYRFYLVPLGC